MGEKHSLLSNVFYSQLRGYFMEHPMVSSTEDQEQNSDSYSSHGVSSSLDLKTENATQRLLILPFIYTFTRGLFFAAPFVSIASTLAAYQTFIQLSLVTSIPPFLVNLFILQIFFLIVSVPMSIFCISLYDKHKLLTPAYNAILIGTIRRVK